MHCFTADDWKEFQGMYATVRANNHLLTALLEQTEKIMALLDTETATITSIVTAITTIDAEVKALQAALAAAGQPVSTTALDAAIASLQTAVTQLGADAAPVTPPTTTGSTATS